MTDLKMTDLNLPPTAVLENWASRLGLTPQIESLGNAGGFSGASFWRITTPEQTFCLRRWPREHPSPARLAWIHRVLEVVAHQSGLPLAVPIRASSGGTFTRASGYLWELTLWLPGKPVEFLPEKSDPDRPAEVKRAVGEAEAEINSHLQRAMRGLASFHQAGASHAFPEEGEPALATNSGLSPGLTYRAWRVEQLLNPGYLSKLRSGVSNTRHWPDAVPLARSILAQAPLLAPKVLAEVQAAEQRPVALQPCARDIWSDHLLFTEGELTGWVDFGAMRWETPCGDIARLLASMAGDNSDRWQLGLSAYGSIRPLADQERSLVRVFDVCQVLLAGINWIEWIFVEQRKFEHRNQIEQRMRNIARRLSHRLSSSENLS